MVENKKVEEFEELYNALETIIKKLNGADIKLEEAIKVYKEGVAISKKLETIIEKSKKLVDNLDIETVD